MTLFEFNYLFKVKHFYACGGGVNCHELRKNNLLSMVFRCLYVKQQAQNMTTVLILTLIRPVFTRIKQHSQQTRSVAMANQSHLLTILV